MNATIEPIYGPFQPMDEWTDRAAHVPIAPGGDPNPLDVPPDASGSSDIDTRTMAGTFFRNERALALRVEDVTLQGIADRIAGQTATDKANLPLLKLASFGDQRSKKHCLRHDDNVIEFGGIEGDHDTGKLSFDDAVAKIRQAKIRALLYTSASYVPGVKERWRILVPLSQNYPPKQRPGFVAWLNGLLGGVLAGESFTLSQSFYYGHVGGRPYRIEITDGDFLDLREDLKARAIDKPGTTAKKRAGKVADGADVTVPADWQSLIDSIHAGEPLHTSLRDLAAKLVTSGTSGGTVVNLLRALMEGSKAKTDDPLRWMARVSSIPDLVESAEQFREPEAPAPGQTDPVDLWAKFDTPTLPRGVLPAVIEAFAFDRGMVMGCDMGGLAVSALAVCGAAIPDSIQIQPKKHDTEWLESARLWVAPVGSPSTMKSPMMAAAAKPLRRIDNEMARDNQHAMADYNKLPKEEKQARDRPKQTRLMIEDTTIEAAQEVLKDSPNGVLSYQDELSGWFGAMDKYSGGRGAAKDRGFWLQSFNGGSHSVDRIGRGSAFIPNRSVSMLGGIQPEPIRKLAEDGVDDGLLQRLIPIVLRPAVPGRDEKPSESLFDYNALISRLHELKPPMMTGGLLLTVTPLKFDGGALVIREELEKKHLELGQCYETINRKLASHIGKYNGIFARLCVVWHCVEHAGGNIPTTIPEATAQRVKGFLHGYLLPHARAFYAGVLGMSDDHDALTSLAGYILTHKPERITYRDCMRGDTAMKKLKPYDAEVLFERLHGFGWVTRTPGPRPSTQPHWIVNPAVHERFAEHGRAEAKRRERVRAVIAETLGGTGS